MRDPFYRLLLEPAIFHVNLLLFFSPVALRIHVSNESHARLVELGGFYFEERGQVQIKVTLRRGLF